MGAFIANEDECFPPEYNNFLLLSLFTALPKWLSYAVGSKIEHISFIFVKNHKSLNQEVLIIQKKLHLKENFSQRHVVIPHPISFYHLDKLTELFHTGMLVHGSKQDLGIRLNTKALVFVVINHPHAIS